MGKARQQSIEKKKNITRCSICMEKCARATIDCTHKFCVGCIGKWTKRNDTCPLCRRTISAIHYGKRTSIVQPTKKNTSTLQQNPANMRMRITWKPLLFISIPYFNYFVANTSLMPQMFY